MRNLKPKKFFIFKKSIQLTMAISVWHFSIFFTCFVSFSISSKHPQFFFLFLRMCKHVWMNNTEFFQFLFLSAHLYFNNCDDEREMKSKCTTRAAHHNTKAVAELTNDVAIIISDLKEQQEILNVKIRQKNFKFSFMF